METALEASLNRDDMEKRRLEAVQDLLQGLTQSSVARKFGVSRTTASRWNRALQQKAREPLRKRPASEAVLPTTFRDTRRRLVLTGRRSRLRSRKSLQPPGSAAAGSRCLARPLPGRPTCAMSRPDFLMPVPREVVQSGPVPAPGR